MHAVKDNKKYFKRSSLNNFTHVLAPENKEALAGLLLNR
jgi:hypothetical protein